MIPPPARPTLRGRVAAEVSAQDLKYAAGILERLVAVGLAHHHAGTGVLLECHGRVLATPAAAGTWPPW
jgi:hypothetical protein